MALIARFNSHAAKTTPESVFASPAELASNDMLTRGEKIATLDRWRTKVLHELAAAGEGMHTRGVSSRHADLLSDIDAARRALLNAVPA
jgi:hypothetical protein